MMKLSFLLLLVTIAKITAASNRTRRFLHAEKCDIKTHPSIVSVTNLQSDTNNTKYTFLTGNLITMKWIMILAEEIHLTNYSNAKVVAGTNYELPGGTDDFRRIERTVKHKGYLLDLVLCELDKPFSQNDRIQPVKLPTTFLMAHRCDTLTVVGWGTSSDDWYKKLTEYKKVVGRGDLLKCGTADETPCSSVFHDKFCYNMRGTSQQCQTDYGLGVFCKDILVGVTNGLTSPSTSDECQSTGALAAEIIYYMSWVQETTGIEMPTTSVEDDTTTTYEPSTPPYKGNTNAKYREQFISHSTTEEEHSEISNGQHIKPNCSIYLLLISLLLFL